MMEENEIDKQTENQAIVTSGVHMDEKKSEQLDQIDKVQTSDTPSTPDFGQKLREERIKRGISIAEVAHRLRLSEQQIQAIEDQDFSKLPAAVFLRGYVRNYANLLQLDDTTLLVETITRRRPVNNIFTIRDTAARFRTLEPVYQPHRGNRGGWLLLYVGVILAAFAAYGFYYEKVPEKIATSSYMLGEEDQIVQPGAVGESDQVAVDLPLPFSSTIVNSASIEPSISTEISLPPVASVLPETSAPSVAPVVESEASATTNSGKKVLHFAFTKDSWVKIKDNNGQVILEKINPRGSEQTIEGEPPLYLVIGNAAGVSLTYNGNKVDLGPYTRKNDDVARFSLE